jgi:hypothetical protein
MGAIAAKERGTTSESISGNIPGPAVGVLESRLRGMALSKLPGRGGVFSIFFYWEFTFCFFAALAIKLDRTSWTFSSALKWLQLSKTSKSLLQTLPLIKYVESRGQEDEKKTHIFKYSDTVPNQQIIPVFFKQTAHFSTFLSVTKLLQFSGTEKNIKTPFSRCPWVETSISKWKDRKKERGKNSDFRMLGCCFD